MKVRFYLMRGLDKHSINASTLIGFVRGLEKAYPKVTFCGSIEYDSNDKYFIIDVEIPNRNFERVKGQAESYISVQVRKINKYGEVENPLQEKKLEDTK